MLTIDKLPDQSITAYLSKRGYWPAWAAENVLDGKYSDAVQLCQEYVQTEPHLLSNRVMFGIALYHAGQAERAQEQFYTVLALDPDNIVALKYLGDMAYAEGDEIGALSQYERILEIDPYCRALKSERMPTITEKTHSITLVRAEGEVAAEQIPLRSIPFVTETMGDLYMSQGYHRLAATVYRSLNDRGHHPRLLHKLAEAEEKIKAKE